MKLTEPPQDTSAAFQPTLTFILVPALTRIKPT